jgi:hypothetical protein
VTTKNECHLEPKAKAQRQFDAITYFVITTRFFVDYLQFYRIGEFEFFKKRVTLKQPGHSPLM